ncbi:MAG: hypothetical protein PVJ33_07200 [Lysobacterales bacterium]|jgi:hypothetical protein
MKRWFEENPVGIALMATAGVLIAISLILGVVWTLPPSAPDDAGEGAADELSLDIPRLEKNEPIEAYAAVTERPVFNPSRQPEVSTGVDEMAMDDEAEENVDAPELELAGVIITPSLRMVTLKQKKEQESLVAFEGQPLEGNYGSWHVSRIEPREITLASGSGEELQLQLQVHDAKIEPPPPTEKEGQKDSAQKAAASEGGDDDEPLSRAEEIRQRIAERREELRRAAEEAKNDGKNESARSADYRSAIQSMISGRRKTNQADNDDDQ